MNVTGRLADLQHGQLADFFAQLSKKERTLTRRGQPYYRLEFRDQSRDVVASIWEGSPLEEACRDEWTIGHFYKIRGRFNESIFGGSIEISKLRPIEPADEKDGFDPANCQPRSQSDPQQLFDHLLDIVDREIETKQLHALVTTILQSNEERLHSLPGALHHHHAYAGGFLEHCYSVLQNVLYLIENYRGQHESLREPIVRELAVAGAILHDIGKLVELYGDLANSAYTIPGELIGHITLGRDLIRDTARQLEIEAPWLVRLEHLILSHQGTAEHGSPKQPMTWEANLVHWADQLDGNVFRLATSIEQSGEGPFVSRPNPIGRRVFRGESPSHPESSS